jgi:hypothetical protein
VVADLNGDGIPDLAVANANDNYVSVLAGKGAGTFQDSLNYGVCRGPSALVVGGFTGDGNPTSQRRVIGYGNVSVLLNSAPTPARLLDVVSRKLSGAPARSMWILGFAAIVVL